MTYITSHRRLIMVKNTIVTVRYIDGVPFYTFETHRTKK